VLCLLINQILLGQTPAVQQIPSDDLKIIKSFFQTLLKEEAFGYTIYGTKPISFVMYNRPRSFWDFGIVDPHFKQGIECWKKYHHLFPSKHFTFLFHEYKNYVEMVLINHSSVIRIVDQYSDDFQKILGKDITGEKFLSRITATASDWEHLMHANYYLTGLLLGYGKRDSWLFQRRWEISDDRRNIRFTLNRRKTIPMPEYLSIEEELKDIKRRFRGYQEETLESFFMALPYYMTDCDSPESQALIEEYKKERKKILKAIQGDCFTQVIKKITQEEISKRKA